MSTFIPKTGWILCVPDSDEDRTASGILFPDERRRKRTTVRVLVHNASAHWELYEPALPLGTHVLVEKWTWRTLTLASRALYLIPEAAVHGIIDEGAENMTGQELLDDLKASLEAQVIDVIGKDKLTSELSEADLEALAGDVNVDVQNSIDELQAAASEEEE